MSDDTTNVEPTEETAPEAPAVTESTDTDDKDWKAEADKWKALSRKHEDAYKTHAAKVKEFEESSKAGTEKLTAAEERAVKAEQKAMRHEVALELGLSAAQAKRLVGSTVEELKADAEELVQAFNGGKSDNLSRVPKEKLRPGATPSNEPDADPAKLADAIFRRNRI